MPRLPSLTERSAPTSGIDPALLGLRAERFWMEAGKKIAPKRIIARVLTYNPEFDDIGILVRRFGLGAVEAVREDLESRAELTGVNRDIVRRALRNIAIGLAASRS
jgi:hypothetical protein